jgi:hypothetical protein
MLIASWKYDKGELIERQRYDKQWKLVEYKTRGQLKKGDLTKVSLNQRIV